MSRFTRVAFLAVFVALTLAASIVPTAHAAPMSFDTALREILNRDTEIASAVSLSDAADAAGMARRYHFLPSVSLDGSRAWDRSGDRVTSLTGRAAMNLFRFGADSEAVSVAESQESAARARIFQTKLDRETTAVTALLGYIRSVREKEILTTLEKMEAESYAIAEKQFQRGRIPLQELEKVKIDLENVRSRVGGNSVELTDARAALLALLGSSDVETGWPWIKRITDTSAPATLRAEDFFSVRPDWVIATQESRAQDHLASASFRTIFPSLDAAFAYGLTRDEFISSNYETGWTGTLSLTIPIFNHFEQYSVYRSNALTRGSTDARLEGTRRKIESEFGSVPTRYETAKKTALSREDILKISAKLYQDNLSRYRMGHASSNELNVDLNRYLDTQLNAVAGWQTAHLALTNLYHLTGKSVLQQELR